MILFSSHFANSDEGGEGEKTGPLFLVIVTNWKKGHRCRAALTDTQSRADGGRATLPDFRSVLCIQKYSRAGRAEAVILSIHLGIVSQTEVTFSLPSLPSCYRVIRYARPVVYLQKEKRGASPGSFFKELPSKVPYKQYREKRRNVGTEGRTTAHSLFRRGLTLIPGIRIIPNGQRY